MKAGAACRCARGCPRTTPRHASPAPWAETAFCTPVHFENGLCVWIFRLENHGASRAGPPTCANAGCLIAHTGKRASDFKHEGRFRSERGVKNMAAAVPVGSRPEAVFGRPGGDGPCELLRKQGRLPRNAGRFSKTARIGPHAGCFGNIRPQIARRFSKTARIDWHAGYFGNKGGSRRPLFSKTARIGLHAGRFGNTWPGDARRFSKTARAAHSPTRRQTALPHSFVRPIPSSW